MSKQPQLSRRLTNQGSSLYEKQLRRIQEDFKGT